MSVPGRRRRSSMVLRSLRYLCWWRNSLRRRADRVESMTAAALLVVFLVACPLSVALANVKYTHDVHHAESVQAQMYRGTAILTANAPRVSGTAVVTDTDSVDVAALWTDAKGHRRHGTVPAEFGDRKGRKVSVWLDSKGDIANVPDDIATIKANAVAFGISVIIAAGFVLEGLRRLLRWHLDKGRLHTWEEEWRRVGPDWTRRRA